MITEKVLQNKIDTSFEQSRSSEKPLRSVVKAISWRVLGTLDTMMISWFVSEDLKIASAIASFDVVTKMILYFFHERLWNTIKWGR